MDEIYLDNAASTPIDSRVLNSLITASQTFPGNPGNIKHKHGRLAKQALEKARSDIGKFLNLDHRGIIFTSGATEANNFALRGLSCLQNSDCTILVSEIEHPCVDESAKFLIKRGAKVLTIPVDQNGVISLAALDTLLKRARNPKLISVMAVNNETGVIQPLDEIRQLIDRKNILLHTDAVQALGKVKPELLKNADLISVSGHKIDGPKGIGFLWIRPDIPISPLLVGGGQEAGLRSGTTPVPLIVALASAVELAVKDNRWIYELAPNLAALERNLLAAAPGSVINGARAPRIPTLSSISFPYATPVIDVVRNVACSSGPACGCVKAKPSKVLTAMGYPENLAKNTLRISVGRNNNPSEILIAQMHLLDAIKKAQTAG